MSEIKVLWVDDEIELLKPHIIFLEKKNYSVTKALSGMEALEEIKKQNFGDNLIIFIIITSSAFNSWLIGTGTTSFDANLFGVTLRGCGIIGVLGETAAAISR